MKTHGFTLVELIVAILLVGILSIFAAPRFFNDDDFKARGIADEIITSIRHAQRLAMTRGERYKIDISPSSYRIRRSVDDTAVRHPNGDNTYLIDETDGLPANIIKSTKSIEFSPLGQPVDSTGALIASDTDITITPFTVRIEEETGYAHIL